MQNRWLNIGVIVLLLCVVVLDVVAQDAAAQDAAVQNVVAQDAAAQDAAAQDAAVQDVGVRSDTLAQRNVYMRYQYDAKRRNVALLFVPTMYPMVRGQRCYAGETFGTMTTNADGEPIVKSVVTTGNASRHDKIMPLLLDFMTPRLDAVMLFEDQLLSPLHADNKRFYKYETSEGSDGTDTLRFRPRIANAQLVEGWAALRNDNGNVVSAQFSGEFDMLRFRADVKTQHDADIKPKDAANKVVDDKATVRERKVTTVSECKVETDFRFMGNKVTALLAAIYDCDDSVATAVSERKALQLAADSIARDSLGNRKEGRAEKIMDTAWDFVGAHLLNEKETEVSRMRLSMSPLFNPLHLGYSNSTGLSYKMHLGARYFLSTNKEISLTPSIGYNFKNKQLYYTVPLRYTFDRKHKGWVEVKLANGNRISDSRLLEKIKDEKRDTIDFGKYDIDYFDDLMLRLDVNVALTEKISLTAGAVYHSRTSVNKKPLELLGKPTKFNSFSPTLQLTYAPHPKGPVLTAMFERGIKGVMNGDMEYEKYEMDISYKKKLNGLRRYSLRAGGGLYTNMTTTYFIDFVNFHQNYLPGGWDDDWDGQFQLLNSQWYNASKHYIRMNASYESPLMGLSLMPMVGRMIETERIYLSALHIENMDPYIEMGYAFTNRYISLGGFVGMVGLKFYEVGLKASLELFRRW